MSNTEELSDAGETVLGGAERTWQVRPYEERDLPGLLSLYAQVFGRERTEEEFRWKLQGMESVVDTVWVAADGERIVGQHAGVPMCLKLGEREVFAMHAVEAMTHDDYRKQGMLTLLGGGLYGHWKERGVPIIMGLPHPGWGSRAYALGYREAFTLRWMSRPLRPLDLALTKLGLRRGDNGRERKSVVKAVEKFGDVRVERIDRAGKEIDDLWRDVGPIYSNAVVRDSRWVQWRYLDPPKGAFTVLLARRGARPLGYIAYRVVATGGRPIGRIGDLFAAPDDRTTVSALVRAAARDLKASGAASASVLTAVGSELHFAMRRAGFLLNRGEYRASFIPLSDEVRLEEVSDPSRWLLTGGDFDVV